MKKGFGEVIDKHSVDRAGEPRHALLSGRHQDTLHLNLNTQKGEEVLSGHEKKKNRRLNLSI